MLSNNNTLYLQAAHSVTQSDEQLKQTDYMHIKM